jgi:glycosyltransferase involved in cell wall biosynthesis
VILTANWDWVLYNFRLPFARALQEEGFEVVLISPPGEYVELLRESGFRWEAWRLNRRSIAPLRELLSLWDLRRLYRAERPMLVHHYTVKPILYGSFAARMAKVPRVINSFTGLGYLFSEAREAAWLRKIVLPLFRIALRGTNQHTIFQVEHDQTRLVDLGIISEGASTVIAGTGVDVTRFHPRENDYDNNGIPVILMVARLLWDKGTAEFVDAARKLTRRGVQARFLVAGAPDEGNPASISNDTIEVWREEGVVEFLGHRSDIPELLQQVDIAVLPSYHEGVPLFLLEAAASGLSLVATDIEGCRLIVHPGVNGLLVPPRDSERLADALFELISDPERRSRMGKESRRIAVEQFSQEIAISKYLGVYKELSVLQK